jgi:hypothetical protein
MCASAVGSASMPGMLGMVVPQMIAHVLDHVGCEAVAVQAGYPGDPPLSVRIGDANNSVACDPAALLKRLHHITHGAPVERIWDAIYESIAK